MNRLSTLKPDIGKINILKKNKKKKGTSLADSEDDYEYEHYGDKNSGSTTSGNTAEDSFADFSQDQAAANNQRRPARRASLAGKIVSEWKKKKTTGNADADDDAGYEDPFAGGGFDDMSINYGQDDLSVDASRCDTYLEDDGANAKAVFEEQLSPMSALRKGQSSRNKTKQVKKQMVQMMPLPEGESDSEDDDSSKGEATGESSSDSDDDEYDSFFKFLDQEKQEDGPKDGQEEKPEDEPVKKPKKKGKKKREGGGSSVGKKSKKKNSEDKKKKKKGKKKTKKKKDDEDADTVTSSDLLGLVSPDAPDDPKTVDEEEFKSKPIPPPPHNDLSLDEPNNKSDDVIAEARARRALARLAPAPPAQGQGLSLDAKMGDSRVDRAARRAIRRSSIGMVGGGEDTVTARERAKSRFDAITDGKGANRQRYRRKSMDVGLSLEESEELRARIEGSVNKPDETRPPRQRMAPNRPRYRRKSMDVGLSLEETEELRKRIDSSLKKALS
mmetsp:Transcript_12952/g.30695  ORF Transcript_12952/g.30695 Transcript_12952/m.30695 type:complete len:500 (+) Transcript_12952:183-1682(+)|eukprot:CAMPEP_0113629250 /NCGR_PEP_ID=MMETSP0017_2-20120614/15179_1 /TAXON_ID=2856 /ORGANISM="Cylindrotheca closterium" /LENGTH=499 /DNA_ID=CAMNT_0000539631 /DNA_START=41 /DNA_END=1540 /DNA_ORIENTATION=+ /assembly_acc=CAM_ASM_000147